MAMIFEDRAEGEITMGDLQGGDPSRRACYMPSKILETARMEPPPLSVLLKYGDCVIQADYKGIIHWGICLYATDDSLANVFEMLSAWHARMQERQEDDDVRDAFEMELLSQVKESGYDDLTRDFIIRKFDHLKHDMIHLDLVDDSTIGWILDEGGDDARQSFRQSLMEEYDFSDKKEEDPSLAFVILRSFLKSKEMSKHSDDGRLGEEELKEICMWLEALKDFDEDSFCADKAALLLELLQNAKLDASQLVETDGLISRCGYRFQRRYNNLHPWRMILKMLSEGEALQQQDWNHRQLPLHLLLSRGLPGQDILVDANEQAKADHVGTKCPIEGLYPFQLAATKKDYGSDFVVIAEDTRRSLDQEQLAQVYSLMRASPVLVVESHHSLERDEAYVAAVMKEFRDRQGLKQKIAEAKEMKRKLREFEESIATDQERLAEQRKVIEEMPKYKKQRN